MLCGALIGLFQSSARREAEILVLRQQINVLRRMSPKRPALHQRRSSVVRLAVSVGSDNACGIGGGQPGNGDPLAPRRLPCVLALGIKVSLPEIKSERIDGANLRGADWPRCGQRPEQHATPVHPCSAIGAYERHCNIRPRFPSVSGSVSCPKLRFCLIIACSSRRTDFRRSLTRRLRW